MKQIPLYLLTFVLTFASIAASADTPEPELHWLSSGLNNRDLTISPDGILLLSTVMAPANQFAVIVMSQRVGGKWEAPTVAPFSGRFGDIEPMFNTPGNKLYFASQRPKPDREGNDWDIWYVTYVDGKWGTPVNVGAPVNSPANEFYPSLTSQGHLYFTAEREGGVGNEDIFRAINENGSFVRVEHAGAGVNTEAFEFNAFVSPDERFIIFSSQGREDDLGRGDLYISYRNEQGAFDPAIHLPAPINSEMLDYCPSVVGERLYFTSRRFKGDYRFDSYEDVVEGFQGSGNGFGDIYSLPVSVIAR